MQHSSHQWVVNDVLVASNQLGYLQLGEKAGFCPEFVITIDRTPAPPTHPPNNACVRQLTTIHDRRSQVPHHAERPGQEQAGGACP
jgi:hypothetical protein